MLCQRRQLNFRCTLFFAAVVFPSTPDLYWFYCSFSAYNHCITLTLSLSYRLFGVPSSLNVFAGAVCFIYHCYSISITTISMRVNRSQWMLNSFSCRLSFRLCHKLAMNFKQFHLFRVEFWWLQMPFNRLWFSLTLLIGAHTTKKPQHKTKGKSNAQAESERGSESQKNIWAESFRVIQNRAKEWASVLCNTDSKVCVSNARPITERNRMTKNQLFVKTKTKYKNRTKGSVKNTHTTHTHPTTTDAEANKQNEKKNTLKMVINLYAAHLVNCFNKMINDFRSLKFLVQAHTQTHARCMQSII